MTTQTVGAPSAKIINWKLIKWSEVKDHVRRLQMRIAKAIKIGRYGKVKALQWLLTHSFYAKLLAIRRVTQNKGKNTAGVDGVTWKTNRQKIQAVDSLKRRGYKSSPLRRIHIPKKNGKLRPLGIPTMQDRAQQALHLLALEPIAEIRADKNSYGFRPKRSIQDAIEQCFIALAKKSAPKWILEGDIKACFDRISHQWLINNIMMDRHILEQWLKAGFIEKDIFHSTEEGTPQGGIASPTLANIVLDGLEMAVKDNTHRRDKVNFVRYADDFICTATSKETLEQKVLPIIIEFLKMRGLELSMEKTKITHIDEGFDFLGFNLRKYNGKLLIKPAKKSIKAFMEGLRETICSMRTAATEQLISTLNSKIRGWANHYRCSVAKKIFGYIDKNIFSSLWRWVKRRHPNKNTSWIRNKYFTRIGLRNWCFFTQIKTGTNENKRIVLTLATDTCIKRHIKIRAEATPYDPAFQEYFRLREKHRLRKA